MAILIQGSVLCMSPMSRNYHDLVKKPYSCSIIFYLFIIQIHATGTGGGVLTDRRILGEVSLDERGREKAQDKGPSPLSHSPGGQAGTLTSSP